jgi:hypothetical protein
MILSRVGNYEMHVLIRVQTLSAEFLIALLVNYSWTGQSAAGRCGSPGRMVQACLPDRDRRGRHRA